MTRLLAAPLLVMGAAGQATEIYAEPPRTVLGCECAAPCETSIFKHCNAAPYCTIKSQDCNGGRSSTGYDYCVYGPYQPYESLTAQRKRNLVMARVNEDKTSGEYPSQFGVLTGIMGESVQTSFEASSDVFPEKRTRYIHSVGVTGGIRFDSLGNHEYTGLFQGAEHGIIRLSSAKEPSSAGTAPGMGIKFFRDGRPSANFVAMYSLDGQPCTDNDFFTHDWNNHIETTDNFGLKLIAAKFWQASFCPLMVGLSDLSTDANGKVGKFPFKLNFHALTKSNCPCEDYAQCLSNLATTPVGTKLFEVRAQATPQSELELIGHISLTDKLTTSKFGDEQLFFRHQHMEEDWAAHPEWLDAIDKKQECGMSQASTIAPPISKGCSSPFHGKKEYMAMLNSDSNITLV